MKALCVFLTVVTVSLVWLCFVLIQSPGVQSGWYQSVEVPGEQAIVRQRLSEGYAVVGEGSLKAIDDEGFYLHLTDLETSPGEPEFHYLVIERRDDEEQLEPLADKLLLAFAKRAFVKLIGLNNIARIQMAGYSREETKTQPVHRYKLGLSFSDQYVEPDLLVMQNVSKDRQWIVICGAPNNGQYSEAPVDAKLFAKIFEAKYTQLEVQTRRVLSRAQGNLIGF